MAMGSCALKIRWALVVSIVTDTISTHAVCTWTCPPGVTTYSISDDRLIAADYEGVHSS